MSGKAQPSRSGLPELAFWAPPEVWRALIDAYNSETNRTLEAHAAAAEDLAATIEQAADEALR